MFSGGKISLPFVLELYHLEIMRGENVICIKTFLFKMIYLSCHRLLLSVWGRYYEH